MAPVRLRLSVQWGEMDAYGHVNNIVYLRWFESARMEYFRRVGWPEVERETGVGPILRSTRARFRAPVEWPDEVEVTARVAGIGADRFTMHYQVRSLGMDRLACEGEGVVVSYDYPAKAKAPLPAAVRQRIEELEGTPEA